MEIFDPSSQIRNSQRITDIFGHWPSFHDAEIQALRLEIADGKPWVVGSDSPILEMTVHVFEMTKDVTPEGYLNLAKHTLVQIRFCNVEEVELLGFSFQNCIFDLEFGTETASYPQGQPVGRVANLLTVKIDSSVGLRGGFRCHSAEVVSAEPCDDLGKPINAARS